MPTSWPSTNNVAPTGGTTSWSATQAAQMAVDMAPAVDPGDELLTEVAALREINSIGHQVGLLRDGRRVDVHTHTRLPRLDADRRNGLLIDLDGSGCHERAWARFRRSATAEDRCGEREDAPSSCLRRGSTLDGRARSRSPQRQRLRPPDPRPHTSKSVPAPPPHQPESGSVPGCRSLPDRSRHRPRARSARHRAGSSSGLTSLPWGESSNDLRTDPIGADSTLWLSRPSRKATASSPSTHTSSCAGRARTAPVRIAWSSASSEPVTARRLRQ